MIFFTETWFMMKKRIALLLVLMLLLGISIQSYAAEGSSGTLVNCSISISSASNGVRIIVNTLSTTSANEIGAKDIVLQEKVNGSWKNINISGGSNNNSDSYGMSAVYTGAVKGRTYRAYCTHYAKFGSTTKTSKSSTGEMVFN